MSDSPHIFNSTDATFGDDVILKSDDTVVLIDFWAPWCGPCRMLAPILEQLAEHYKGNLLIAKVNTDENPTLAEHFAIRGIPALKLIKDREVVFETTGVQPFPELQKSIDPFIQTREDQTELNDSSESPKVVSPEERIVELKAALIDDKDHEAMNLELVSTYLINNQFEAAFEHFDSLSMSITETDNGQKVRVLVDFYKVKTQAPDYDTLNELLMKDPSNHTARHQLGVNKLLEGYHEAALQDFMYLMESAPEYENGLGRKSLVAAFSVIDDEDVIKAYRRKMASLLN